MYFDYLKQMLGPLRVYTLESGAGAEELAVIGEQLDGVFEFFETLIGELLPATAQSYGLKSYESLLPYRPAFLTTEDRQEAVAALLRIRSGCFSKELLQKTIAGCGISAVIDEGQAEATVVISFPQNRGVPENIDKVKKRIEQIVPCHLAVEYYYIYVLWSELMALAATWGAVEELCDSWGELEIAEAQT